MPQLSQATSRLLRAICEDAIVYDIDMSDWYERIDVYVGADHLPPVGGRLATFRVSFLHPVLFCMSPLGRDGRIKGYPVLNLCGCDIIYIRDRVRVEMNGMKYNIAASVYCVPITIECSAVSVEPYSLSDFDVIRPGWGRPAVDHATGLARADFGLLRPGPVALARMLRKSKRRTSE